MSVAISNTSPLLYLYRIGGIERLEDIFQEVWVPEAVVEELKAGHERGYDTPSKLEYPWMRELILYTCRRNGSLLN